MDVALVEDAEKKQVYKKVKRISLEGVYNRHIKDHVRALCGSFSIIKPINKQFYKLNSRRAFQQV